MPFKFQSLLRPAIFGLLVALGSGHPALAESHDDDGDEHGRTSQARLSPKYRQECAACHVAFPPAMLPATSWQQIMNNLPHHYGTDASLDPATSKELGNWLAANAGTNRRATDVPPENRITRSAWFVREHAEVSAATWKSPAVKSAANCIACHTRADQGDFNEHNVRIPR